MDQHLKNARTVPPVSSPIPALTGIGFPERGRAKLGLKMIRKWAFDYKVGSRSSVRPLVVTGLVAGIAALALALAAPATGGEAQHGGTATTCTNAASGANWQITIDYDRGTVDSNPARISDAQISWRDATDGGNYSLDRKSGKLTVVLASSTGGYFLYHHCKLEN
jgi:hypothetical protein